MRADLMCLYGVTTRLLLNQAFKQADGESHAARLYGLRIARRQQGIRERLNRLVRSLALQQDRFDVANGFAGRRPDDGRDVWSIEQVRYGRRDRGNVKDLPVAYDDNARTCMVAATPYSPNQEGVFRVVR
ncbi:hypothetical protein X989_3240 [Burkholderia pseudomallei MSHR4378]|nr:hypothetical protein X989_3240 [Burkholderia pseudomallei MSHR4378]